MNNLPRTKRLVQQLFQGLLLLHALSLGSPAQATDIVLQLNEITPPSSFAGVRGPVWVYLEEANGNIVSATALARHAVTDSDFKGNGKHTAADASGLTFSNGLLSGVLTAALPVAGTSTTAPLHVTLNGDVANGLVSGNHNGTYNGVNVSGTVNGTVSESAPIGDAVASVFLDRGMLRSNSGMPELSNDTLNLSLSFSAGLLEDVTARFGTVAPTVYSPQPGRQVFELISPLGDSLNALITDNPVTASSAHAGAIVDSDVHIEVDVSFDAFPGRTFRFALTGTVIDTTVIGSYQITEGGTVIASEQSFLGNIGPGGTAASRKMPGIDPLLAGPANGATGFAPPYFGTLSPAAMRERIRAGAIWLTQAPEVAIFSSPATSQILETNNKQYDNAAFNAYGGATAYGVLHDLADDPRLAAFAARSAESAGHWLDTVGRGNYRGIATYYKQMFHVTAWGAMAHMDLYETTGEQRWLDAVVGYFTMLEDEVTRRMSGPQVRDFEPDDGVPPGRTWTYLDEASGNVGESSSRNDRSRDNFELNPGSFLWLLGKLRVDHGVSDFAAFEQGAREWVRDNIDDADIWDGGSGVPPAEGATFYALYMVDYAPVYDPVLMDKVIAYIEGELMDWSHPVSADGLQERFAPAVRNRYSRWVSGYLPEFVGGTAATSRMALVYLKRHAISGDQEDLAKAQALAYSVLRTQNTQSGMIHHIGIPEFSADHNIRLFEGPNGTEPDALFNPRGRIDQHPYSALKANALRNLLLFANELEAQGINCNQPQVISATTVVQKALGDPPFQLNASASSGLPVNYRLLSGPATLDGDTVTLDGTRGIVSIVASQAGDATWCAATPVAVYISVGDNTPAAPSDMTAASGSTSTIQLTWTDNADNELRYRVERRSPGASSWEVVTAIPANSSAFTDTDLATDSTFEYRVIASNAVADSQPSAILEASTLGDEQYIFIDIECANPTTGYEVRDNADAGGGQDVLVTINQSDRNNLDPATVLEFSFYVPRSATYALWLRGRAIDGGASDSIWLMVDGGIHVNPGVFYTQSVCNTGYCWRPNNDTFFLEEGMHSVTIAARESNAVLDRILFTTDTANLTQFGAGGPAINCSSGDLRMEVLPSDVEDELILLFQTEDGVQYQLETSTSLSPGSWTASGPAINGNGEWLELRRMLDNDTRFFRIRRN
jgi:hypothetical protein